MPFSRMKLVELQSILAGIKPAARQGYHASELPVINKFCEKNSLFAVTSKFKVIILDKSQEFSNKGLRVPLADAREGMLFVYISKDERLAYRAALHELQQDHISLGRLLGYPECCCGFFAEQEPIRSKLDSNYELPAVERSVGDTFPFCTNIFLRHKDYCLLSHFPCHLNCGKSIELGKNIFSAVENASPALAAELSSALRSEIVVQGRKISFV